MIDHNIDNSIIDYIPISASDVDNISQKEVINNNHLSMSKIKKVFKWFVLSSTNPQLISLTVKGLIPLLLLLGVEATAQEELGNALTDAIVGIGIVLSAFLTLGGLIRKIYISLK